VLRSRIAPACYMALLLCLINIAPSVASFHAPVGSRGPNLLDRAAEAGSAVDLIPEAKGLQAPSWVREGLRVYYRTSSATIENPFAEADDVPKPPVIRVDQVSASAPAVVRTDVIALAPRFSATYSTIFIGDLMIPWDDSSSSGFAGIGEFWINPAALRNVVKQSSSGLSTEPVRLELGGKAYSALRLDSTQANPTRYLTWIFDASTGLLLYQAQWLELADRRLAHLSVAEFVSMRNMTLPWEGGVTPSWVQQGAKLTYRGSIQTWTPAGGRNIPIPAMLEVEMTSIGRNWSAARVKRVFSSNEEDQAITVYSGTGLLAGGFWVPRANLARLRSGERLDRYDPVTGSSSEVGFVGATPEGVPVVAIFEWGAKYKRAWIYRSTDGVLLYWMDEKLVDPSTGMVQQAEWQLSGQ
jgi:hypothetical protein